MRVILRIASYDVIILCYIVIIPLLLQIMYTTYINDDGEATCPAPTLTSTTQNISEIKEIKGACKAYKTMRMLILQQEEEFSILELTRIPNILKNLLTIRHLALVRVPIPGQYPLGDLIREVPKGRIYVHIGRGEGQIAWITPTGEKRVREVRKERTYELLAPFAVANDIAIRCNVPDMLLGFDIIEVEREDEKFQLIGSERFNTKDRIGDREEYCFLAYKMSPEERRNRMVFLACHQAITDDGGITVVEVAVIDYEGKVILQHVVCPRTRVRDYCTARHGLGEADTIGQMDSGVLARKLRKQCAGRIICGFKLYAIICLLAEQEDTIAGMRDIKQYGGIPWEARNGMDDIARLVEGEVVHGRTALREARNLREMYLRIENKWENELGQEKVRMEERPTSKGGEIRKLGERLFRGEELREERIEKERRIEIQRANEVTRRQFE